jgi:hypothetical protein
MQYELVTPIYWIKNKIKQKRVAMSLNWMMREHYQQVAKCNLWYHELVEVEMEGLKPLKPPIHVHYKIFLSNKKADGDNVSGVVRKFVTDGLVECGIIPGDTYDIVVSASEEYHLDKEFPRCEITIKEI